MYRALLNRELAKGEDPDIERLYGRSCQLLVKHVERDGLVYERVTEFIALPGQKPLPVVFLEGADEESGELPF